MGRVTFLALMALLAPLAAALQGAEIATRNPSSVQSAMVAGIPMLDAMAGDWIPNVAMRQGCTKECISGGAFPDVVRNTFFGFSPTLDGAALVSDPQTSRPFQGTLTGVRHGGRSYQLTASARGVQIAPDPLQK